MAEQPSKHHGVVCGEIVIRADLAPEIIVGTELCPAEESEMHAAAAFPVD